MSSFEASLKIAANFKINIKMTKNPQLIPAHQQQLSLFSKLMQSRMDPNRSL